MSDQHNDSMGVAPLVLIIFVLLALWTAALIIPVSLTDPTTYQSCIMECVNED